MTTDNLKRQTVSAAAWQISNGVVCNIIQLAVTVILARHIMPDQYGIIAIISIFIAVAQTLVSSNLSTALIRKDNRTDVDCSTVFYYNIALSIILYIAFYFIAPVIAGFYAIEELTSALRVLSVGLIIGALSEVQKALYAVNLDFKTTTLLNILSTSVSGVIGVILAVLDFKIWALIVQSLSYSACNTVMIWCVSKWRPVLKFSNSSLREFFSFGSKLMTSKLIDTTFRQLYSAVIGKLFAPSVLGLYNRAEAFVNMTSQVPSDAFSTISYPVLCRVKDDDTTLKNGYRRIMRLSAFIIFPLCLGMCAVADPLVNLLLTDKWAGMTPMLQLLSLSLMWYPVHALNLNLIQVKGRSDLYLRLEIFRKIIIIITLAATMYFGIIAICMGRIFTSVIALFVNSLYTSRISPIKRSEQFYDLLPALLLSIVMYALTAVIVYLSGDGIVGITAGIATGLIIYIGGAAVFRFTEMTELRNIIKMYF